VFLKLGTSNVHLERNITTPIVPLPSQHLSAGSLLITAKIPRFYLKQGSPTPTNLIGSELKQYGNHVCSEQDPLAHFRRFKRLQMGIFGFSQKETGAKSVAMATT